MPTARQVIFFHMNLHTNRRDFRYFLTIPTRWMDNDIYGHVNNVIYYSWVDTVVNEFLIHHAGLDIHHAPIVGFCVDSGCTFKKSFAFPELVHVGLRVAKIGNRSVRFEIGLFGETDDTTRADAFFVQVYVDRATSVSVPIPEPIRNALATIAVEPR
jgi:acyl-CoA thioester hydrolase